MATQLTAPGLVFKWLVVPVGCAALGYFLVGSRIGHGSVTPTTQLESQLQAQGAASTGRPAPGQASVAVVHHRKKRKHHRKKTTVSNPDNSVTPTTDANFPQAQPPGSDESDVPQPKTP